MGFVIFDNLVWCASTKVWKLDSAYHKKWAQWFRCMAAVYQTVAALIKFTVLLTKKAKADAQKEKAAVEGKIHEHRYDTAKVALDLATYFPLVGYDKDFLGVEINDGVVGLCGGFASLISLRKAWRGLK